MAKMPRREKPPPWSTKVDAKLGESLRATANHARDNASSLLEEARLLLGAAYYARAGALAILSEEESAKAFILAMGARDGRWDSALHEGIRDHGSKQMISQTMLQYANLLLGIATSSMPHDLEGALASLAGLAHDHTEITKFALKAKRQMQERKQRDRLKQRLLYVDVDKSGSACSRPDSATREQANDCIEAAEMSLRIAGVAIDPVRNTLWSEF